MSKKALVLCGGGAKGAYQIGAMKALKEIGYKPDIVIGTSVGALNGCFQVMNDLDLGYKVWSNIDMDSIFSFDDVDISNSKSMVELTKKLIKSGESASYEPLMKLIDKCVDEDKIRKSNIEYGFVTTQFMPLKKVEIYKEDIPYGHIKDYIMASAACYPYMKSYSLNNKTYIDGGYFDNMPIDMAINKGADEVVVIDLKGIGKINKLHNMPAKVKYIESKYDLGGIMLFDSTNSKKNIKLGYYDTLRSYNKVEGNYYYFQNGENVKASKDEIKINSLYSNYFTSLPTAPSLEIMGNKSLKSLIASYNQNIFKISSNVLNVLEIASSIFQIDYLKVYTYSKLKSELKKSIELYKRNNDIDLKDEVFEIINDIKKLEKIKDKKNLLDKRTIVLYLVSVLKKDKIDIEDKKQIWIFSIVFPDCVFASLYIASCI